MLGEYTKSLNDRYYLEARDINENMELCYLDENGYGFTIIFRTIYAVGQNESFIIAKQHPDGLRTKTNYYIIPIKEKISNKVEDNILGPMTQKEFIQKKQEIGISNLDFDLIYEQLK